MHVEQPPNSPYRSAEDHCSPSAACLPAAHFHSKGVQPHSWEPRLLPACPTCPCVGNKAQSHCLAALLQMDGAIAAGKRCQGCSELCWAFLRSQLSSWGVNQCGDIAAGGWM